MTVTAVVLTQPASRVAPLRQALQQAGFDAVHWPLIRTVPEPGVDWQALFAALTGCAWAVLPSPAAIGIVMAEAAARGLGWPRGCGIALVGPGSVQELQRWHRRVPGLADTRLLVPDGPPYDAGRLIAQPLLADLHGQRIAVLRRSDVQDRWLDALAARGASVQPHVVYRACSVEPEAEAAGWLAARAAIDAPTRFSVVSADAGRRLAGWIAAVGCGDWALACPVLTVHPRIADALAESGWRVVRLHRPGTDGLLEELESLRRNEPT